MPGAGSCATGAAACLAADHALAFVADRLVPADRASVEHRLATCAGCRAVVDEVARRAGRDVARDPLERTALQRPGRAPSPRDLRDEDRDEHRDAPAESSPVAPDGGLTPGEVLGRYIVERPLGAGGMGVVSLARDPELRRPVVIKLVHPSMVRAEGGDELEARLRREAQAMAQLSHSNVVQIFDIGRRGDRVFLAMEFVPGQTLDAWLGEKPRSSDEILAVICQAGAGLAAAHRAGLVHRDFKPSNVLINHDGVAKVTDFGLARAVTSAGSSFTRLRVPVDTLQLRGPGAALPAAPLAPRARSRPSGVHAVLTQADSVVGTPAYMAPEQAAGRPIDARTDQYAFAVTLLDALLGQSPSRRFVDPTASPSEIDAALARVPLAPAVRAAIVRALAEEPADRFATIDALLRAIAPPGPSAISGASGPPAGSRLRRTALALVGLALCAVAAVAWFAVQRDEPAVCTAEAPARWTGAPRDRVVAALSAVPRPFAGWDAELVAASIDRAVDAIGDAELARCHKTPLAGSAGTADCIARRTAALAAALAALSASPPPDDLAAVVRPIESCDPAPPATALRSELRTASPARAREIADDARTSGDDALAGDALELAGLAALAAGDPATADADLRAMSAAGERAGDDAARARALLHLIDVARWRGDYPTAKRDLDDLRAMVARHRNAARDQLTVALAAASAFTDLGDVTTAFAAWDAALTAAGALDDRDAALTAALGRAWSTHVLRFDLAGARREATAVLTAARPASPDARAAALAIAADLAIADRDGAAALAALAEAHRLVPTRAGHLDDRLRIQRGRALLGELGSLLADLDATAAGDPASAPRIAIARGHILLAAGRPAEAHAAFDEVERAIAGYSRSLTAVALSVPEHLDLRLADCDAQLAATRTCSTHKLEALVKDLHPRAPARARVALARAAGDSAREFPRIRSQHLVTALDILVAAGADPLQIASLRWQVAQLGYGTLDHRALATAAREAFQAAGRSAEVTAIDTWLAETPASTAPRDAGAATSEPSPKRGPQP